MDKLIVTYSYKEMLLNNKMERTDNLYNNMNLSQNFYAEGKGPDIVYI